MSYDPVPEQYDLSDYSNLHRRQSTSLFENTAYKSGPRGSLRDSSIGGGRNNSRPSSPLSTNEAQLLPNGQNSKRSGGSQRWTVLLHFLLYLIPLAATIAILCLNAIEHYWQDFGLPNQNPKLQALQYAAKLHEVAMAASLTAIVVARTQRDLNGSEGVPIGFLTACFQLGEPLSIFRKEFRDGIAVTFSKDRARVLLPYLLLIGFALTLVVGPSSAVAMIPRLHWWNVSKEEAFGSEYEDRVYFNRTEAELWPAHITNAIYANISDCSLDNTNQDCAVRAADVVGPWISRHQSLGTKPNITVFQGSEVTRFLTSQGGPPDNSSWTVTSTIGWVFADDLDHYWDWLVENSSLPLNINRPLLRPAFRNPTFKFRKPLVQVQCHTWFDPDYEHDTFQFPHDELLTPPLKDFKDAIWHLPNDFVVNLKGNDSSIGDENDIEHPYILFDWFDTASEFSDIGAPSLGAVIIYLTANGTEALCACSIDGRWAPVNHYLNPKDTIAIRQDSSNPMDILNGSSKVEAKDLIQMKMSLEWANTMNVPGADSDRPSTTTVEKMLQGWSGGGNFIYPEPEPKPNPSVEYGFVYKSLDWRLSTTLGLYLTEGLGRAFSDVNKGSMLYRQTKSENTSYVRYMNDINQPALKVGYVDGKPEWLEMHDPHWNPSIPPWNEWAPEHGYTEIVFTIQRNGYGYGFDGLPIKLAATVLAIYILVVCGHLISLVMHHRVYDQFSDMSNALILAWSSTPMKALLDSTDIKSCRSEDQVAKIKEVDDRLQLIIDTSKTATN
ncbi:hypothetical protein ACLMJK_006360 [Lecanora helva]